MENFILRVNSQLDDSNGIIKVNWKNKLIKIRSRDFSSNKILRVIV